MITDVDREFFEDMLRYAEAATRIWRSADSPDSDLDETSYLALWQAISMVGEAGNQISPAGRAEVGDINWRDMIGMRHRLVHGYRNVRPEYLLRTVRDDIPSLIATLQRALKDSPR